MLLRVVLTATVLSLSSLTAFAGDTLDIPACNDFLTKWQSCITKTVTEENKAQAQGNFDTMRKQWLDMRERTRGTPAESSIRELLEKTCKSAPTDMKESLEMMGCASAF